MASAINRSAARSGAFSLVSVSFNPLFVSFHRMPASARDPRLNLRSQCYGSGTLREVMHASDHFHGLNPGFPLDSGCFVFATIVSHTGLAA